MKRIGFLAAALFVAANAFAQDAPDGVDAEKLEGTLQKIRTSGVVAIGYREASFPFSYTVKGGKRPIGYSLELCDAIVDDISEALDGRVIEVKYVPVTAETRIDAVESGRIDLECGSTTNNVERQKRVAFSPIFFVAGTKLLVHRGSPIKSYLDLNGKTVAVTAGTTNEQELKRLAEQNKLKITFLVGRDHDESFENVVSGKANAFATDDALLYGFIARKKAQKELIVVGDYLTYDPYGIMYRKNDPQMKKVVDGTFSRLAEGGNSEDGRGLEDIYARWFLRRLPTGEQLNLPMSAQLREIFRVLGLQEQ
jgi:glutamate/aspartate transport system substrate-binding protein